MEEKKINEEVKDSEVREETYFGEKPKKEKKVSAKEYAELQDLYQKALATAAHHQNLSKYYQSEYDKMLKYKSQSVIESILPSIDAFELAFKVKAPSAETENYKLGFEYIYKMLMTNLEAEGLTTITPVLEQEFDSNTMQVVDTVATTDEEKVNHVAEVLLNGYKLKERLIRASSVKIYVLKETATEEDKEAKN